MIFGPERRFHSYVRDDAGGWRLDEVVLTGHPMSHDAALFGKTAVVGVGGAVEVWRLVDGKWASVGRVDAPKDCRPSDFGRWFSFCGDTLAISASARRGSWVGATLWRERDGAFAEEARVDFGGQDRFGALAAGGQSLVTLTSVPSVVVYERGALGWFRTLGAVKGWERVERERDSHPFAGDGDLVVASSRDTDEFVVLQRRDDGWYRQSMAPELRTGDPRNVWSASRRNVALSGRTAVVGLQSFRGNSGRAWIFDITDEDLARATKIESDVK